jgi:hypothetical protein
MMPLHMNLALFGRDSVKKIIPIFLAVTLASLRASSAAAPSDSQLLRVTIDLREVRIQSFFGLGIQWDPYSYRPRPEAWSLTLKRLDYARPAFFRVMLGARDYCQGFDATGAPRYVWTDGEPEIRKRLGSLLDILDYAQSRNIDVLLGEWSPPGRLGNGANDNISRPDDSRWARLMADFVAWLRANRGYSVIHMFNIMNEPNGTWMWRGGKVDYAAWAAGIRHLRKEFDAHGLRNLPIVGPDNSWDWEWIDRVSREFPECIGEWEMHWYAKDKDVFDGEIEKVLSAKRRVVSANDPQAASKRFFLAESGLLDGKTNGDQQPRVKTFAYGVIMSDYVTQVAQAGWMGACAWDLDDAMHTVSGHPPVPDDRTLKVWGFWNTQGTDMGHPGDEDVRPWFYTWSLMSRLFPRDTRILAVHQTDVPHLRILAGVVPNSRKLNVMLVNDTHEARMVTVCIPGAGRRALLEYHYFDTDQPIDADDFAAPKESIPEADLETGVPVAMPSRGVVFLSTS